MCTAICETRTKQFRMCFEMRSLGMPVRPQSNIHQLFLYSRSLFRTPRVPTEHEIRHSLNLMSRIPLEELGLKHHPSKYNL